MSNETKRDVFEDMKWELIRNLANTIDQNGGLRPLEDATKVGENYATRYADALPDDLPVITEAVGEWIKKCKHRNVTLADTLCMEMRPEKVRNWMAFKDGNVANDFDRAGYLRKQDLMASAWLLGVWRVEETGEIVKLEEEK